MIIAAIHRTLDPAHCLGGDARNDPDAPARVLGPMRYAIIGGPHGRDGFDPYLPSGALRGMVSHQGERCPEQAGRLSKRRSWQRSNFPLPRSSVPCLACWPKPALAMESQISARASTKGNRLPVLNAKLLNPRYVGADSFAADIVIVLLDVVIEDVELEIPRRHVSDGGKYNVFAEGYCGAKAN